MCIHSNGSEEPSARKRPRTVATLRIFDRLLLHPGARIFSKLFALAAPDLRALADMVVVPIGRNSTLSAHLDVRVAEGAFESYTETSVISPGCTSLRIPPLDGRAMRVVVEANGSTPVMIHLLCIRLVQAA